MPADVPPDVAGLPAVRDGLPRGVELAIALLGLIAASPLLLVAGLAVIATSPGPALFHQRRVGRGGRTFTLHKLRSMSAAVEGSALTGSADRRVTRLGRWLRRTKIDE